MTNSSWRVGSWTTPTTTVTQPPVPSEVSPESRSKISTHIRGQFPSFIRDQYPTFIDFVKEYYKSQELKGYCIDIIQNWSDYYNIDNYGELVTTTTLISAVTTSSTTIDVESTRDFPSEGLLLIDEEIIYYQKKGSTLFQDCGRGFNAVKSIGKFDQYKFENTVAASHVNGSTVVNLNNIFPLYMLGKFKEQFLSTFPKNFADGVTESTVIKRIKDFYASKGSTRSFQFVLRALFGVESNVSYPRDRIFKPSDAFYSSREVIRAVPVTGDPISLVGQVLYQEADSTDPSVSAARIYVKGVVEVFTSEGSIYEIDVDTNNSTGSFVTPYKTVLAADLGQELVDDVVTVDSTIGWPEQNGRFRVEDEIISYTDKTVNQFLGCSRARENTINRAHDAGQEVFAAFKIFGYSNVDGSLVQLKVYGGTRGVILNDGGKYYLPNSKVTTPRAPGFDSIDPIWDSYLYNVRKALRGVSATLGSVNADGSVKCTVITVEKHRLVRDDVIRILNAPEDIYNNNHDVVGIVDANTFEFNFSSTPANGISGYEFYIAREFAYGKSDYNSINVAINKFTADVQNTYKTDDTAIVTSTGIPSHKIGPFGTNDLTPGNQRYLKRLPLIPSVKSTKTDTPVGQIGIGVNGVPLFSYKGNGIKKYGGLLSIAKINGGEGYDITNPPTVEFEEDYKLGNTYATFTRVKYNGNRYVADNSGVTSTTLYPTHTTGTQTLGTVNWTYEGESAAAIVTVTGSVTSINVTDGGSGYTTQPIVSITGGGATAGNQASATAQITAGSVTGINIVSGGFGYTSVPTITITGGNGTGAAATAVCRGPVNTVTITDTGSQYTYEPTIKLITGSGAVAYPSILNGKIESIIVTFGGSGYYGAPDVVILGDGVGATAFAQVDQSSNIVTGVVVTNKGAGYTAGATTVSIVYPGSGAVFQTKLTELTFNEAATAEELGDPAFVNRKTTDNAGGGVFQGENYLIYGGEYGYLHNPKKLRFLTKDSISTALTELNPTAHSPIIGWAYDGHPIYGPYGYVDPENASPYNSYKQIISSYRVKTNRSSLLSGLSDPLGTYIEDYEYIQGLGDLDEYNGRFCVTPEYPNGVYAYFTTIKGSAGEPAFPYFIGPKFYAEADSTNWDGNGLQKNFTEDAIRYRAPYVGVDNIVAKRKQLDNKVDFFLALEDTTTLIVMESGETLTYIEDGIGYYSYYPFIRGGTADSLVVSATNQYSSSGIDQYLVEGGGKEYKVNDRLLFDNTGTNGDGVSGVVSTVEGVLATGITNAVSSFNDIYTTTVATSTNHYLLPGDQVTVSVADNSNTRTINTKIYNNKYYFKYYDLQSIKLIGAWTNSTAYNQEDLVYVDNRVYKAASSGTSDSDVANAPTHTSGSVSDGNLVWTYVRLRTDGNLHQDGWSSITGGSNYENGTYSNVPITTNGSGLGARATIVVTGNSVSSVTITSSGTGYNVGDTISADNINLGNATSPAGSGFTITLTETQREAVFHTTLAHQLGIGDIVLVSGVSPTSYNNTGYQVVRTESLRRFTIKSNFATPAAANVGSATVYNKEPKLQLIDGHSYNFDTSDASNNGKKLAFTFDPLNTDIFTYKNITAEVLDTVTNEQNSITVKITGLPGIFYYFDLIEGANVVTYTTTVAAKTSAHAYFGQGSGNGYYLVGGEYNEVTQAPALKFVKGATYKFEQNDSSNTTHAIYFSQSESAYGGVERYETNVTYTLDGVVMPDYASYATGFATATTRSVSITVAEDAPSTLYYACQAHGYMGNRISVSSGTLLSSRYFTTINDPVIGTNIVSAKTDTTFDYITALEPETGYSTGVSYDTNSIYATGGIKTITIGDPGRNYSSLPKLSGSTRSGSGATATATISGSLSNVSITNDGAGYNAASLPTAVVTLPDFVDLTLQNVFGSFIPNEIVISQQTQANTTARGQVISWNPVNSVLRIKPLKNERVGAGNKGYIMFSTGTAETNTVYSSDSQGSVQAISGTQATVSSAVSGGGKLASVTITQAGSNYRSAPDIIFDDPYYGSVATASLKTQPAGNGTFTADTTTTGVTQTSVNPNGASGAEFTIVTDGNGRISTVTVTAGGSAYDTSSILTFDGTKLPGGDSTEDFTIQVDTLSFDDPASIATVIDAAIDTVTVTNGGSGFLSAPTVSVSGGNGINAVLNATIQNQSVTAVTIETGGQQYQSPPVVNIEQKTGSGASILLKSSDLGKILKISGDNITYNYSHDRTLKPSLNTTYNLQLIRTQVIDYLDVVNGGQNFVANPTIVLTGGQGSLFSLKPIIENEVIQSVLVENAGRGFTSAPTVSAKVTHTWVGLQSSSTINFPYNAKIPSGTKVTLVQQSGQFPEPLLPNTTYYAVAATTANGLADNQIRLATSLANANTETTITFTSAPTGDISTGQTYFLLETTDLGDTINAFMKPATFSVGERIYQGASTSSFTAYGFVKNWDASGRVVSVEIVEGEFKVGEPVFGEETAAFGQIHAFSRADAVFDVSPISISASGWERTTGFLDLNEQRVYDSDRFQEFSYDISSSVNINNWKNPLKFAAHPAGFKVVGTQVITQTVKKDYRSKANLDLNSGNSTDWWVPTTNSIGSTFNGTTYVTPKPSAKNTGKLATINNFALAKPDYSALVPTEVSIFGRQLLDIQKILSCIVYKIDDISDRTINFDASSSSIVNTSSDQITLTGHGFLNNQRVIYNAGGDRFQDARDLIINNIDHIVEETIGALNAQYPSLNYNNATCARDTRLVIAAWTNDLKYGGNYFTVAATNSYIGGVISQGNAYIDAGNLLKNNKNLIAAEAVHLMLEDATVGIPSGFAGVPGGPQNCIDDIVDCIEAIAYNLTYGANSEVWDAANLYVNTVHLDGEETQAIWAFDKAKELAADVIVNTAINIQGSHGFTQVTNTGVTFDAAICATVDAAMDTLFNIITTAISTDSLSTVTRTNPVGYITHIAGEETETIFAFNKARDLCNLAVTNSLPEGTYTNIAPVTDLSITVDSGGCSDVKSAITTLSGIITEGIDNPSTLPTVNTGNYPNNRTGTPVGGLTNGSAYYVKFVDANTIQLATTEGGSAINLSSLGTGVGHSLRLFIDGINDTFKLRTNNIDIGTKIGHAADKKQLLVMTNGLVTNPATYTFANDAITFLTPPLAETKILCMYYDRASYTSSFQLDQIGDEIKTFGAITSGNTYSDGVYTNVPLKNNLGGGVGATADITVTGGKVTGVALNTAGNGYTDNDVLGISDPRVGEQLVKNFLPSTGTYAPASGEMVLTIGSGHGLSAPTTHTPGGATYSGTTGLMVVTINSHGLVNGDQVKFADGAITFNCGYNGGGDEAYPRSTDYASDRWLQVFDCTENTFTVQVLDSIPSTNTDTHTFVSAVSNSVKFAVSTVRIANESLQFSCGYNGGGTASYPRATDPIGTQGKMKDIPVEAVGTTTITVNALNGTTATNTDSHTWVGLSTYQFQPTDIAYTPTTGEMVVTVSGHGMIKGDRIYFATNSLTFTCGLDNNQTQHTYPRVGDPSEGAWHTIDAVTNDTFTVNVGVSSDTSTHTFVSATSTAVTRAVVSYGVYGYSKNADGASLLRTNQEFIATTAYGRMMANNAGFSSSYQVKCIRDTKLLVDAVADNIEFGGNDATYDAANFYVATAHLTGEEDQSVEVFNAARDICRQVMRNLTVTTNSYTVGTQVKDNTISNDSGSTSYSEACCIDTASTITTLWAIVTQAVGTTAGGSGNLNGITRTSATQPFFQVEVDTVTFDGTDKIFTAQVGGSTQVLPASDNFLIFLNSTFQVKGTTEAYTYTGSTITFTEAPLPGMDFYGFYLGKLTLLDEIAPFFDSQKKTFTMKEDTEPFSLESDNVEVEAQNNLLIFLNGIYQEPGVAFTLTGSIIEFSEPPRAGSTCEIFIFTGSAEDVLVSNTFNSLDIGDRFQIDSEGSDRSIAKVSSSTTIDSYEYTGLRPSTAEFVATIVNGAVTQVDIINAGSNYEVPPILLFQGGGGEGAFAETTIEIGSGRVTGVVNLQGGANYTSAPTVLPTHPIAVERKQRNRLISNSKNLSATYLTSTLSQSGTTINLKNVWFDSSQKNGFPDEGEILIPFYDSVNSVWSAERILYGSKDTVAETLTVATGGRGYLGTTAAAHPVITGTYSSSGTLCTVTTSSNHNLSTGQEFYLDCTSGTGFDGSYKVTVTTATSFTVEFPFSRTASGNCSLLPEVRLRSL